MSDWYSQVNNNNSFILEAIKKQPFIIQLMDGSLSDDVFKFYINQDALYLAEYKKILSLGKYLAVLNWCMGVKK